MVNKNIRIQVYSVAGGGLLPKYLYQLTFKSFFFVEEEEERSYTRKNNLLKSVSQS